MAVRRGIGRGFSNASSRISSLIDLIMKSDIQEQSQRRQNQYISERQEALANQQHGHRLTERMLSNPEDADRMVLNKQPSVGGVDPNRFKRSIGEVYSSITKPFLDADNLSKLPPDIHGLIQAQNSTLPLMGDEGMHGFDEVLKTIEAKRAALGSEAQVAENAKERFSPETLTKGFIGRNNTFMPTEGSGRETGLNKLAELKAGEASPEGRQLRQSLNQSASRGTAGGNVLGQHDFLKELGAVEQAKNPLAGGMKMSLVMGPALRMLELAKQINNRPRQPGMGDDAKHLLVDRVGGQIGASAQTNPAIVELNNLIDGMAITFTGLLGHTGVRTQKDVDSTKRMLPDWGLWKEDSDTRNFNFIKLLQAASQLGSSMPPIDTRLPPEQQSAEYQQRLMMLQSQMSQPGMPVGAPGKGDQVGTTPVYEIRDGKLIQVQ